MKAKKYLYQTAGKAAALAACLLLFSCSGDDLADYGSANGGKHSDNICFSISAADKAMAKGASLADSSKAAGEYTAARFVMRSPDTDDTLCVQTVISDGINVTSFEGGTAATRGVPVTSLETYGLFHVQAHCTDNGTPVSQFYMDDNATKSDGTVWSTSQVRYWPGENRTLQFFAWAPADAAFTATPGSPESTTFEYEVPALAADQKDIVVATTDPYVGNYEQQVPLTFKHILTAVKFETGSQMQPGTIKSVALKGVKKSGTYTAFPTGGTTGEGTWTLNDAIADYTQELNKTTTGTETNGTPVTAEEGTFMMLPQTLPDDAEVEVVFLDQTSGQERTLSASIAGTQWPQGKTVTYSLSITPEYEFKLSDERILDAHYEIYTTSLVVSGVAAGQSWTITAPNDVTVQAQSDMNRWARQGYWTDRNINERGDDSGSARGTSSYSNSGSGEFPIAIFVPENIGDDKRSIALSISVNGNAVQTINIEQYAPSWYGSNIGCERLEGDPQPWGFYWSNDYALTFDLTNCNENDRESLRQYVEWTKALHTLSNWPFIGWIITAIFGNDIPDLSFVDMKKSNTGFLGAGGIADEITINLGQLNTENIAESTDNGQQNTRDIYNFQGIQLVNEIINRIQNVGGYDSSMMKETGTGVFPTNNAAIACMKLNSWNVVTANNEEILQLTNNSPTPDWYLPASGEITGIHDDEIPLSGNYWTSTSVQGSHENAYKYDNSGAVSQERRDTRLNVRAVRKK